ncbi:TlpA disulfide reductase family protein [Fodinibius sp. Rm-B-1B1-1]|uniref:peroxiredoxin family protein n=1 Tax=Fodinibius alkaliphilus TaxID=3140241 RepID=UPI003159AA13
MEKFNNLTIIVLVLFLFAAACTSEQSESEPSKQQSSANVENELKKAPNFEVETLKGDTVSLKKAMAEDKPLVVYFTASWCPVCAKNWPVLSEVYPDYKDQLNFVAIGIDPTDTREVMVDLAEEKGFKFPTTWGHPQIMVDFGVESQATTVGVNRDGYIVFQKNKTALSEEEYRDLFDQLVNN